MKARQAPHTAERDAGIVAIVPGPSLAVMTMQKDSIADSHQTLQLAVRVSNTGDTPQGDRKR
jgi:hypothetical protein